MWILQFTGSLYLIGINQIYVQINFVDFKGKQYFYFHQLNNSTIVYY